MKTLITDASNYVNECPRNPKSQKRRARLALKVKEMKEKHLKGGKDSTPVDSGILKDEELLRIEEDFLDGQQGLCSVWELACYPMDSKLFLQMGEDKSTSLVYRLAPLLERGIPKYPDDVDDLSHSLDLVSLLSSSGGKFLVRQRGDQVALNPATFRKKYVLICCFHVPVLWGVKPLQSLINLCEELYSTRKDFEMVMVARMNSLADEQAVFYHFFSAFPSSCLAVPYKDSKRRDRVCKHLGLGPSRKSVKCHFFDASGKVVPSFCEYSILSSYGAEAFPFTKKVMASIDAARGRLRNDELSQLLKPPHSSPDVGVYASQFNAAGGSLEVSISERIKCKHVGLYMCGTGELIPSLWKLYDQCRMNERDFEIVVLYCPYVNMLDPKLHKEKIDSLLRKQDVRGWLCLPFNNSVTMRLRDLTRSYDTGCPYYEEKLIVVGSDGKILDMYGAEVVTKIHCGFDSHPFTRDAHVTAEVRKLGEITLKSLFETVAFYRVGADPTSAHELLQGKKVIIYMNSLQSMDLDAYLLPHTFLHGLVSNYTKMKLESKDEFEVVFIDNLIKDPLAGEEQEVLPSMIHQMPWYVYVHPDDGTRSQDLVELMKRLRVQGLFGFGVDGKLCSFRDLDNACIWLGQTLFEDVQRLHGYGDCREI